METEISRKCVLVSHVIVRVDKCISALYNGDVVNGVRILREILDNSPSACPTRACKGCKKNRTVSLNLLPSPVATGAIRSWSKKPLQTCTIESQMWQIHTIKKVTRKKLIFSWSTNMSTAV